MPHTRPLSSLLWKLCLPEYFLRPRQILLRARRKLAGGLSHSVPARIANLPWGLRLRLTTPELIQNAIWFKGVYDVVVTETIWRLLDVGDTAVDVGAHIGYMSSVMAARVGARGRVLAFEPHPDLFRELTANVSLWPGGAAVVHPENVALSARLGTSTLALPADWLRNRGVARVVDVAPSDGTTALEGVATVTLDSACDSRSPIALMKLDVEGHELAVLQGAAILLRDRAIRDIVFEDMGTYPSAAMAHLEAHGYTIFSLAKRFRGPRLGHPDRREASPRDDPNYLATLDPARAAARLSPRGWRVLATAAR